MSCHSLELSINETLAKFWEIEEGSTCNKIYSKSEEFCENHFAENYKRASDGRFIVKFPFKENLNDLGLSRNMAYKRLCFLQKRLNKDKDLKGGYVSFLSEYQKLGYMTKVKGFSMDNTDFRQCYYLPHHAVIKESSLTTRLRVVFDASVRTDTNLSLNDVQFAGPTIQNDSFKF
ncbi:uncharacterized protein LOC115875720 [Sitophilus oryzae]|uniref:Uncharacterized protein LOC115874904 n=1 Tax=Sitophilus oryzae TaxID=7048 RepID=A0A6J2X8A3_SITOR|nr:uncharacterized protein LOC115874904 [Sitophilus oryzae]XP_030747094.1 uncharacterized protein LOC115875720 [Sitophilus oryzae]